MIGSTTVIHNGEQFRIMENIATLEARIQSSDNGFVAITRCRGYDHYESTRNEMAGWVKVGNALDNTLRLERPEKLAIRYLVRYY